MRRTSRRAFLKTVGAGLMGVALLATGSPARGQEAQAEGHLDDMPIIPESNLASLSRLRAAADVQLGQINATRVRVYLCTSVYSSDTNHNEARVSADGTFNIVNVTNEQAVVNGAPAGTTYVITSVTVSGNRYFRVQRVGDASPIGSFTGPMLVQPHDHNLRARFALTSSSTPRSYRGYLEVRHGSVDGKVRVDNVLDPGWLADPIDKYLYGVVPAEMPSSYPKEALKAQAVAARSYAARNYTGAEILVYDSVYDQAYYGYGYEQAATNQAVEGTRGVVATYGGSIISAMYSSCCGGHTEHSENVYPNPVGYLRGVRCNDDGSFADISGEDTARAFWTAQPASFCNWTGNGLYRWYKDRNRDQLQQTINAYLGSKGPIGDLDWLDVTSRGVSGKIKTLVVRNRAGASWEIKGDYAVRQALRDPGTGELLLTSNLVFDHYRNGDGTLAWVRMHGGGWGHGVGMCQRGAKGMAERGQSYAGIITRYYTGIALEGGNTPPPAPVPAPTTRYLLLVGSTAIVAWTATAAEYYAELRWADGTWITHRDWSSSTNWAIGVLGLGAYEWRVKGRIMGSDGKWIEGSFSPWQRLVVAAKIYSSRLPLIYK